MTTTKPTAPTKPAEQALRKALEANPEATAADLAAAAGVGRSTAGKVLAHLATSGEIQRTDGAREGARRLPDRFSLASAELSDGPRAAGRRVAHDGRGREGRDR